MKKEESPVTSNSKSFVRFIGKALVIVGIIIVVYNLYQLYLSS